MKISIYLPLPFVSYKEQIKEILLYYLSIISLSIISIIVG